jgi:hypothetical protein
MLNFARALRLCLWSYCSGAMVSLGTIGGSATTGDHAPAIIRSILIFLFSLAEHKPKARPLKIL